MTTTTKSDGRPDTSEESDQLRAFACDDETRRVIDQVVGELMMPQAAVHKGGIAEAIAYLGENRSPRLLVVDISAVDLPLSAVNELAEVCEPGVAVITVGDRNDVGLFRDLIGRGISDYLVKPITPSLLQRALLNAGGSSNGARQAGRLGRLVVFVGTRGGVGATLLCANVAWSIANQRRRRVVVLDLDLQFGSVGLALDLEPSHGLREAIENPDRLDGLYLERAIVQQSETLHVLSAEEPLDDAVLPDPAALEALLRELRSKYHYVLVDQPRGISPSWQHVLQSASNLVIVTDLSLAGMRDTLRIMSLMPTSNAGCQLTLVANRVGEHRQGEIAKAEYEKGIGRPIDVLVPFDGNTVAAAMNVGRPVVGAKTSVAKALDAVAERLCGAPQKPAAGPLRRWLRRRS
jgi:pilus assembly protein CpaE